MLTPIGLCGFGRCANGGLGFALLMVLRSLAVLALLKAGNTSVSIELNNDSPKTPPKGDGDEGSPSPAG
ncbi:MAG: hypothetical protein AAFX81_16410 [Pseudomonadota bacterium]